MLIDITIQHPLDEPLPPPVWLVGSIVATALFVAAALLVAIPQDSPQAPVGRTNPVRHTGGFSSITRIQPSLFEPTHPELPDTSKSTPIPFDPANLSLPVL